MNNAYAVGQITIRNPEKWAEYRDRVPASLAPWGAEIVFRGRKAATLAGGTPHDDIVVIRFPDAAALRGWFESPAYQALVPLREQAAEVTLLAYET